MLPGWFHTAKKVGSAYDRGRLPLVGGLAGRAVAARLPDSLDLRDIGAHVAGMICIRLIAPAEETARGSPALSARITALIVAIGTPKRRDASAM